MTYNKVRNYNRPCVPIVGRRLDGPRDIRLFPSMIAAAAFLGVTPQAIQHVVRGKHKACKGWHFVRQGVRP